MEISKWGKNIIFQITKKKIHIKRKLLNVLLLIVLIMNIMGCSIIKNPIAEEYSKETYIIIENLPEDSVYGMRMHILDSEREYEIVEIIDLQYADPDNGFNGDLHLGIEKDSLPECKDYSKYKLPFSIFDKDQNELVVEGEPISFEFGKDYCYDLALRKGKYYLEETRFVK